jgi:cyanophycin synthetase
MRVTLPKPKPCPECGSEPIYHRREFVGLILNTVMMPIFSGLGEWATAPLRGRGRGTKIYWGVYITHFLAKVGLGEFVDKYDDMTLLLDQVLWDEAKKRGIVMREFRFLGLPTASFVATYPNGKKISFGSFPIPPRAFEGVWWIDTKTILKRKLARIGIPIARGGAAFTRRGARKIFRRLEAPVIVKPYEGSGSRHTTIHVTSESELERAFRVSQQITPLSIIEEELAGEVYRPTLVGGTLVATIRRDKPSVVGDGTHTVRELVEIENEHPKRQGPYYSRIALEEANLKELARQGMTPQSIPQEGARVMLHQKINWSVGGTTTDVTDEVHPDNRELFEQIARLLRAPLIGIDFVIEDISRSWKEQKRCGVIECNSRPFFDNHHLPFAGQPRNVAGAIWDYAEL